MKLTTEALSLGPTTNYLGWSLVVIPVSSNLLEEIKMNMSWIVHKGGEGLVWMELFNTQRYDGSEAKKGRPIII